jgi:hypothetical protein
MVDACNQQCTMSLRALQELLAGCIGSEVMERVERTRESCVAGWVRAVRAWARFGTHMKAWHRRRVEDD